MKVKILLDQHRDVITAHQEAYGELFAQLRTPLTQYRAWDGWYALDNGCFKKFHESRWLKMALKAGADFDCEWIVMPDVVGDHASTLELFRKWMLDIRLNDDVRQKAAFVAQDGCTNDAVPWDEIVCLFIGGSDYFKNSFQAAMLAVEAKGRGVLVHVGRVNTPRRLIRWFDLGADSIDGSGVARFSHMLIDCVRALKMCMQWRQTKLTEFY